MYVIILYPAFVVHIKFVLQFAFSEWSVAFCLCACNVPAHELAAIGRHGDLGGRHVWLVNLPNVVAVAVAAGLVGPW